MATDFESVHTVDEYYDGPRSGIADYQRLPHFYRSVYLDGDTWDPDEDRFELSPLPPHIRDLATEAFRLWHRWQVAADAGAAPDLEPDDARVLPEHRARYAELQQLVEPFCRVDPRRRIVARGLFEGGAAPGQPLSGFTVRWLPVEPVPPVP